MNAASGFPRAPARATARADVALVVSVAVFAIIGLAVGIDAAWAYLVGCGALVSVFAGIDQFANRSDPLPDDVDEVAADSSK